MGDTIARALALQAQSNSQALMQKTSIPKTLTNLIVNGNFSQNNSWLSGTANVTITNGEGDFVATANFGKIYQTITLTSGHKYYYCANFNSSSNNVKFDIYDGTNQYALTAHPGNSQYYKASGIFTSVASNSNTNFRVVDYRTSGWDTIRLQNCVLVDLTNMYGTGKEPSSVSDFEALIQSRYGGLFFDGTKTLFLDNNTPRYMPNLVVNGNFKQNSTWAGTLSNVTIDTVNGEGDCTATAKFGQIYQYISLTSGHKYYYTASVLANSANVSFDVFDGTNQYGLTYHPGNGQYVTMSGIITATSTVSNVKVRAMDSSTSGWSLFKLKNVVVVDLTAFYGAGNEPIQADFEGILRSQFGGTYYDGTPVVNLPQYQIQTTRGNQYVKISGTNCKIQFQYTTSSTMWTEMDKCGPNSLFALYKWHTTPSLYVDGNFTNSTNVLTAGTDFIGPMIVAAQTNITGDNTASNYFTGGWHSYNNTSSGGTATARQISTDFYVNGAHVSSFDGFADELRIVSVANLQGYNTTKSDGSGREIIQQTVTWIFKQGYCEVLVKLNPLEAVTIQTYYGIQTSDAGLWGSGTVFYPNGSSTTRSATNTNNDCGVKSSYPNVDRFSVVGSGGDMIIAWVDNNFGLGTRSYVASTNPLAFTQSYGKSYFNLVNGSNCSLSANFPVYVRGGYAFTTKINNSDANIDSISRLLRNGKMYNVIDFITADTAVISTKSDEWFKTGNTVEELQKTNITGISNNTWDGYTVTSTGAGSYVYRFTNN
jgi:hypothetical protein